MFPSTPTPSRSRRRRTVVFGLAAVCAAGSLSPSVARACWFDPIIFDPQNFTERVMQFQQLLQQVSAAKTQIANQLKTLGKLQGIAGLNPLQSVQQLQSQLQASVYQSQNPASALQSQYPLQAPSAADYQQLQQQWTQGYRQVLVENRQVEDAVYRQMPQTTSQIQQIVTASNSAPGETAAIQAHNDLLAVLSSELASMEALRATRLRAKVETRARKQSEDAYTVAQGSAVLQGASEQTAANPITGIFQDGQ